MKSPNPKNTISLSKMYNSEEIEKMTRDERFTKLYECINRYHDEFEKRGLQRIRIQKK